MRFTLLLPISIVFIAFNSEVKAAEFNDLKSTVGYAIENNPEIQASWHALSISEYDTEGAKAGYRPSVDVTGSSSFVDRNYGLDRDYMSHIGEVTLTQMLFDGFRTSSEVKKFKQAQMVRYFELLSQVEQTALEATIAYTDVLLYQELLLIAEQNLRMHVDVFKQIEESVVAGVARRADLEQISGRLSLSEANVITELSNLHDVSARYLRIVGIDPAKDLQNIELPNVANSLKALGVILQEAYTQNPSFSATLYNIDSKTFDVDSAKSRYQPKVDVVASYGSQSRDQAGLNNTITEARVGFQFSYNLYNGGADSAAVSSALQQVNLAKDLRDKSCRDIRQTIQIARNNIINIERQLPSLNEHRVSSDRVKTAYFDQFNIGERTLLDLLDSENEYYESSRAYILALNSQTQAYFNLLAGKGELTRFLGLVKKDLPDPETMAERPVDFDPRYICPGVTSSHLISENNILVRDSDADGITDLWDECKATQGGAIVDERGCAISFQEDQVDLFEVPVVDKATVNIQFKSGSSKIDSNYEEALQPIIDALNSQPNTGVIISGHASLDGDATFNKTLSEERAFAVAQVLINNYQIAEERVTAIGYGEERPIIDSESQAANAKNRRIEAIIVSMND
ncbi:MAG: TolC family outer membrane protein [Aliiglaciecola sp.]|uniref:TolC family outer membrane protein n=1 Tax=Aliiglaciecola sp. TaxID=1872441 RepID=UPI003299F6EF